MMSDTEPFVTRVFDGRTLEPVLQTPAIQKMKAAIQDIFCGFDPCDKPRLITLFDASGSG
jgi:hypothetical protein